MAWECDFWWCLGFVEVLLGHHGYLSTIQGVFRGGKMVPSYDHPAIEEA